MARVRSLGFVTCILLAEFCKESFALHPRCDNVSIPQNALKRVEDVSALLHGGILSESTCVFNPAVMQYEGDLYLWAARAYDAADPRFSCSADPRDSRPLSSSYRGHGVHYFVMAITRTLWNEAGLLSHQLLGYMKNAYRLEDPRLFRDDKGAVQLLAHQPRGGLMMASAVTVNCSTAAAAVGGTQPSSTSCGLALGAFRWLLYHNALPREKNWVPHDGTTRMSYPVYPSFGPHSVFDWRSYIEPEPKAAFDSVAPEDPFFARVNATYLGFVEFSGSTPAVLSDDGASYIAVGHMRADASCFHDINSPRVMQSCTAASARDGPLHPRRSMFTFLTEDSSMYSHHILEYAMFFYRFSAKPPYEFTHVSHAIVPCSYHHDGIVYPSGLTRIGPNRDFLISFGEADRYSRIMTISASDLDAMLLPLAQMAEDVGRYSLCAVPCAEVQEDQLFSRLAPAVPSRPSLSRDLQASSKQAASKQQPRSERHRCDKQKVKRVFIRTWNGRPIH